MKYVYLQDNSTPDKVVRRMKVETKIDKFKYNKFLDTPLIVKDEESKKYRQRGMKFLEVDKETFIESCMRGLVYAKNNYEDIGLDFDTDREVKKLSKKLGLTQKEIKEKLKKYDVLEAEFIE